MLKGNHIGIVDPAAIRNDFSGMSLTGYFLEHGVKAELIYPKDLASKIDELSHLVMFFAPQLPQFIDELTQAHSSIDLIIVCPQSYAQNFGEDAVDGLKFVSTMYQLRQAIMGENSSYHLEMVEYASAKTHLRLNGNRFFDIPQNLCSHVPGTSSEVVEYTDKGTCDYCQYASSLLGGEPFVSSSPNVIVQGVARAIGLGFDVEEDIFYNAQRLAEKTSSKSLSVQPGGLILSEVLYSQPLPMRFKGRYEPSNSPAHIPRSNAEQLGLF